MPLKEEHQDKAEGNERFSRDLQLRSTTDVEWALVALFYSALHYVEAYFATRNWHFKDHSTRDGAVSKTSETKPIYAAYRYLKDVSRAARYDAMTFKKTDVDKARPYLEKIKSQVSPLL